MKETSEQGRSMIEMLGVLAIIGVLSVGGIAGFSKAMERYRVNKTIQQVTYIAGNIRTLFGSQKDYADLEVTANGGYEILKKANIVPKEVYIDKYNLVNPFGGGIHVTGWKKEAFTSEDLSGDKFTAYDAFFVSYYGIPQEACVSLATQDWEIEGLINIWIIAKKEDGYINRQTGGYSIGCKGNDHIACPGGSVTPIPMPIEKAVKACSSVDNNRINWLFY